MAKRTSKVTNNIVPGLIADLRKQGLSNAAIARAVGRDSSLIAQAAKGTNNKGQNLIPALQALQQKAAPPPVARRVTKSGAPAKVRQSTKPKPEPKAKRESKSKGRTIYREVDPGREALRLLKSYPDETKLSVAAQYDNGQTIVYYKKGITAEQLLERYRESGMNNFGDFIGAEIQAFLYSTPGQLIGIAFNIA